MDFLSFFIFHPFSFLFLSSHHQVFSSFLILNYAFPSDLPYSFLQYTCRISWYNINHGSTRSTKIEELGSWGWVQQVWGCPWTNADSVTHHVMHEVWELLYWLTLKKCHHHQLVLSPINYRKLTGLNGNYKRFKKDYSPTFKPLRTSMRATAGSWWHCTHSGAHLTSALGPAAGGTVGGECYRTFRALFCCKSWI